MPPLAGGRTRVSFRNPAVGDGSLTNILLEGSMATKLDKAIKRELEIDGKTYTIIMSPEGIKVTPKGGRIGRETSWRTLLGNEAAASSASSGMGYGGGAGA